MTSFFEFSNSFFLCVLCWRKSTKNVTLHCLPFRQFHQHTLPPVANWWNRVVTSCLGVKISLNSFPVVLKEVSNRLTLRGCVTWLCVLLLKKVYVYWHRTIKCIWLRMSCEQGKETIWSWPKSSHQKRSFVFCSIWNPLQNLLIFISVLLAKIFLNSWTGLKFHVKLKYFQTCAFLTFRPAQKI